MTQGAVHCEQESSPTATAEGACIPEVAVKEANGGHVDVHALGVHATFLLEIEQKALDRLARCWDGTLRGEAELRGAACAEDDPFDSGSM